jgi:[ribosomal protein S18]-alanine N-acetyltransferase
VSVLSRFLGKGGSGALVVEPLRQRHLAAIMPIEGSAYPKPWSLNVFQSELEMMRRGERCYLVARDGRELVGYGGVMFALDDAHVTNIAVATEHQRRGVATRVLAELAWAALEHGSTALTLEVRVSNTAAQALYQRFGFEAAGVRAKYYENVEDAIVMWCRDIGAPEYRERLRSLCPEGARASESR